MSNFKGTRMAGTAVAIAALAACVDSPIAPGAMVAPQSPSLAVTLGTPPTVRRDLEGQVWVCKSVNAGAPAGTFTIQVSASNADASAPVLPTETFDLQAGQCALVYAIDRETTVARYALTVTETVLPSADWALTGAAGTTIAPFNATLLGTASINGTTVTGLGFIHDQGVVVTLTNTYTPPATGCTYTQGYWKTHSQSGPAPYDAGWQNLGALEEDTPFFLSGQTWLEAFNTPVAGNQYYSLAHQYMAAKLNVLNGAGTTPEVITAIADAEALFALYTPAQIAALKGSTAPRPTFVSLAGILGSYNEGLTGPGHCN